MVEAPRYPLSLKLAIILGSIVAMGLFGASEFLFAAGAGQLARTLEWQAALLQGFVPTPNLGTVAQPLYEGTPLHLVAWYAGVLLGIPLYTLVMYVSLYVFRWFRRSRINSN